MKIISARKVVLLAALGVLAACALPRGAPVLTEVAKGSQQAADAENISVVPITRESAKQIKSWPQTGWRGHYSWLARQNGPASNILRVGDTLNLTIWDNAENSLITGQEQRSANVASVKIDQSGMVFVPYVDEVQVAGLTATKARQRIQEEMSQIAPSAQVQLQHVEGVGNSVDLVSGVANPGPQALPNRNFSILSLISLGGGVSPSIRNPVVRLVRNGRTYEIPASSLFADPAKNIIVRGGDQVLIEEDRRSFVALGATAKEELVYFHKEKISGLEAVSMLGGVNDARGNPAGLLVMREYKASQTRTDGTGPEKQYVVFTMDMTSADGIFGARNFYIHPGDAVMATESAVKPAQSVMALVGSVFGLSNSFE
ncbi:MAG: polysaccharide export protein [Rhodobacteraceae bacterium]|nr:polysaccharide export protein [Paracoccaceae bacterium]